MTKRNDLKVYCFNYVREQTSVAEALYDSSYALTQSHKFHELLLAWHMAKIKPFSLEVYNHNQTLAFCFAADGYTADVMAGMMYLNHPDAEVEEIPDYVDEVDPEAVMGVADVSYLKWDIYPSSDYKTTMCGAMDPVLRAIAEVPPHFKVLTQLCIQVMPSTVRLHSYLWACRQLDRAVHLLRPKYWFRDKETREQQLKIIHEKAIGKWIRVNCRIMVVDETEEGKKNPKKAQKDLNHAFDTIMTGYSMQNHGDMNIYAITNRSFGPQSIIPVKQRHIGGWARPTMRMYTKEIPGFFQLPNIGNLNVRMKLSRHASPPRNLPSDYGSQEVSMFGESMYRGHHIPFGIRREDRQRHMFVLGKTDTGKSGLLQLLIQKDLQHGQGVGVIDPNGTLIDKVLELVPEDRVDDVIIYDPSDIDYPASLNPFELVNEESRMRVATGLLEMFRVRFEEQWNDRVEHLLLYTILALLSTHWTTVLSIKRMIDDEAYRDTVIPNIKDKAVKEFWEYDFPYWQEEYSEVALQPLARMISDFVSSDMIKNSLGQPFNKFDFREIMDSRKILLMKISNRLLGDDNASLLGAMVMTRIYYAAMSRADVPFEHRPDFYLYVDEFDEFATASFEEILSESRKYRLNLTLSTQHLNLLPEGVRGTIFGNVGNLVAFRTSSEDSNVLAKELAPRVWATDLANLPPREFFIKMMVGAKSQEVFSGRTLDIQVPRKSFIEECIETSRSQYCISREQALEIISTWGQHG